MEKNEYIFHQCKRYSVWSMEYYTVQADTQEEAQELFLKSMLEDSHDKYSHDDFELMIEDMEEINGNEVYDENGSLIYKEN